MTEENTRMIERLTAEMQAISDNGASTLFSLYNGEVYPAETNFFRVPGYKELAHEAEVARAALYKQVAENTEVSVTVETYHDALMRLSNMEVFEMFACGFGLAVRMMAEGLQMNRQTE